MVHDVTFTLPERALGNADAEFKVKLDGEVLGRLKLSKGALVWVRRGATYGHKMTWARFDEIMQEHGTRERA